MKSKNVRALTYGAVCVSLSYALSFIGYTLPNGGTVTPASLVPIILYCYLFGFTNGLLASLVYTFLQIIQGSAYLIHPAQVALDYVIPFVALCVISLVPRLTGKEYGLYAGLILYALLRWASQTLSGTLYWSTPFWGSLVYNTFGLIDVAVCAVVLILLFRSKVFKAELARIGEENRRDEGGEEHR